MNKLNDWFEEVWLMVKMWWGIGLMICLFDGLIAFCKVATLSVFILAVSKSLLIVFFIGPLLLGSAVYFIKTHTRWL